MLYKDNLTPQDHQNKLPEVFRDVYRLSLQESSAKVAVGVYRFNVARQSGRLVRGWMQRRYCGVQLLRSDKTGCLAGFSQFCSLFYDAMSVIS